MNVGFIFCILFPNSKPNVTAVEVLPVYPDFKNWKYPCAQVIFDSDPAPANSTKHITAQMEEMSQAMIRLVHFKYIFFNFKHQKINFSAFKWHL